MATTTKEAAKPEAFDWDAAKPWQRDAWLAANVMPLRVGEYVAVDDMGAAILRKGDSGSCAQIDRYTTDPAADYEVLKRVRSAWDREMVRKFSLRLFAVLAARRKSHGGDLGVNDMQLLAYELAPGDYSHAAYLALSPSP